MLKLLTAEQKAEMIDQAIERIRNGEVITVADASFFALGLCIGDFRNIGWSERCTDRYGMWYEWNGPTAIVVGSNRIEPGHKTIYVEMDWS
jgi:hypothetical protein